MERRVLGKPQPPAPSPQFRLLTRRQAVQRLSLGTAIAVSQRAFGQAPAIVTRESARPLVTDGVASTVLGEDAALVWSRADRPSRLVVEYATTESFANARRVIGTAALEGSDFTARVRLSDLPRGQRIFYRAHVSGSGRSRRWSESVGGQLSTAPAPGARDVSLVFSADTVGQGWGLDDAFGGLQTYASMLGDRARSLRQPRRRHLCRPARRCRGHARRRPDLAQPCAPGQEQGRGDGRRIPRQLSLQPPGRAHAALQCGRAAAHRVGRPRGARQLVSPSAGRTTTRATP